MSLRRLGGGKEERDKAEDAASPEGVDGTDNWEVWDAPESPFMAEDEESPLRDFRYCSEN